VPVFPAYQLLGYIKLLVGESGPYYMTALIPHMQERGVDASLLHPTHPPTLRLRQGIEVIAAYSPTLRPEKMMKYGDGADGDRLDSQTNKTKDCMCSSSDSNASTWTDVEAQSQVTATCLVPPHIFVPWITDKCIPAAAVLSCTLLCVS